jgi:hypothetical protein
MESKWFEAQGQYFLWEPVENYIPEMESEPESREPAACRRPERYVAALQISFAQVSSGDFVQQDARSGWFARS